MSVRSLRLALAFLALAAAPAAAQVRGLPVVNSGAGKLVSIGADIGFGNDASGTGTAYGLTGGLGFGPLGVTATLGSAEGLDGDRHATYGATVSSRLVGGPLAPIAITLQGGAGRSQVVDGVLDNDINETRLHAGLGVALRVPLPILSFKPWIAPRLQYTDYTGDGNSSTDLAVSAGLDFDFIMGLGVRASYDRIFVEGAGSDPHVFALGGYWRFGL